MPRRGMTVGELADALARLPRDLPVMLEDTTEPVRAAFPRVELSPVALAYGERPCVELWGELWAERARELRDDALAAWPHAAAPP